MARDEIAALVEGSDVTTQIAVVQIAAQPRVVVGFGDDRLKRPADLGGDKLMVPASTRKLIVSALVVKFMGAQKQLINRLKEAFDPTPAPWLAHSRKDQPHFQIRADLLNMI